MFSDAPVANIRPAPTLKELCIYCSSPGDLCVLPIPPSGGVCPSLKFQPPASGGHDDQVSDRLRINIRDLAEDAHTLVTGV